MTAGIIVLEGADGTGKTTLAGALLQLNGGGAVVHQKYRWKDKMPTYHMAAVHRAIKLAAKGHLVIIDRLWLSEYFYADEFRGGTKWPGYGSQLQRILSRFGAIYVVCYQQRPDAYKHHYANLVSSRPELYPDVNSMTRVHQAFKKVKAYESIEPTVTYDWTKHKTIKEIFAFGTSLLDTLAIRRGAINMVGLELGPDIDTQIVGNVVDPDFVLIGEKPNCKSRALRWPWIDFTNNATTYLGSKLAEAGISEQNCCFTNILTDEYKWNHELQRLVTYCYANRHPKYLLMGEKAHRAAHNYYLIPEDFSHYLHHPQWYRRFDHHGNKLLMELNDAQAA